jgi:ribosomal protein L12E/L44/L45/RPP1/RPP2
MPNISELNALCQEIGQETAEANVQAFVDDLEEKEFDAMMLAMGPRAFGPDDDSGGLFYWDLK